MTKAPAQRAYVLLRTVAVVATAAVIVTSAAWSGGEAAAGAQAVTPMSPEAAARAKAEAAAKIGPRLQSNAPPIPASSHDPKRRAEIVTAYQFAGEHAEVLSFIPCFCGCESSAHSNNSDCFVQSRTPDGDVLEWEPHGIVCDICVDVAVRARHLHAAGASVPEIRKRIEREFGMSSPRRTPTPHPKPHQH